MKVNEAIIAWTPVLLASAEYPTGGQVKVGALPSDLRHGMPDWTKTYRILGGASHSSRRGLKGDEAIKMLFVDFNTIVVRDGISPAAAHNAFLAIDEYAETISPDIEGAREPTN